MNERDRLNGRQDRIGVRSQVLQTELELDRLMWRTLTPEETQRRAELERKRKELFARMGDPLLTVVAPPDARVSARLPDGRWVRLAWNAQARQWQHRFDLPPGTPERELTLPVWIRHPDGREETRSVAVHVDQSPPTLRVTWVRQGAAWQLDVMTTTEVARVNVALADGRRLLATRGSEADGRITWWCVVEGDPTGAVVIATDRAHNRTEVRESFPPPSS